MEGFVFASDTPFDHRSSKNLLAILKRETNETRDIGN
jgi:hypothetical protein